LSKKVILILTAGLLIGAGLGVLVIIGIRDSSLFGSSAETGAQGNPPIAPRKGALAPDFDLKSLSGEKVSLRDFGGKIVLLNFWATWCAPCRIEMPAIQSRFEQHRSELEVLAINFDEPSDQVQAFVQELGLTFTVLLDPGGEVQRLYQIRGYPTTYIVDESGVVAIQHIGIMTEQQLDEYLSQVGVGG
jgi:peroxiredoxin